jgi:hypothetical protein
LGIGNCSYSSGTPARIALAILGVQSAGFALFYLCSWKRSKRCILPRHNVEKLVDLHGKKEKGREKHRKNK